jgi:hypothetical protein
MPHQELLAAVEFVLHYKGRTLEWQDYSRLGVARYGILRYLLRSNRRGACATRLGDGFLVCAGRANSRFRLQSGFECG